MYVVSRRRPAAIRVTVVTRRHESHAPVASPNTMTASSSAKTDFRIVLTETIAWPLSPADESLWFSSQS